MVAYEYREDGGALYLTVRGHASEYESRPGQNIVCGPDLWLYYHGLDTSERKMDIASFYTDPEENLDLLEKYDVDYIYVSSYERSSYAVDTDTLDRLFTRVFSNWEATIYAVHPSSETEDMGNGASAALRGGA